MVDNSLQVINKLLINSEAFFINLINTSNLEQCVYVENTANKTRSIRSTQEIKDLLKNYKSFGITHNNKLIGFAIFSCVLDEAELIDITLSEEYQSKGIGTKFLQQCFNNLKQTNINFIILEVATNNHQAIKSYKKFNHEQIGLRKNYYKNTDGTKTDAFVYKILI